MYKLVHWPHKISTHFSRRLALFRSAPLIYLSQALYRTWMNSPLVAWPSDKKSKRSHSTHTHRVSLHIRACNISAVDFIFLLLRTLIRRKKGKGKYARGPGRFMSRDFHHRGLEKKHSSDVFVTILMRLLCDGAAVNGPTWRPHKSPRTKEIHSFGDAGDLFQIYV